MTFFSLAQAMAQYLTAATGDTTPTPRRPGGLYTFGYFRNGVDIITDFVIGEDKVWLSRSGFFDYGNYGPTETLRDELFVRNADGQATRDGGPQLVQNSTTGVVYYDVDGTGDAAPSRSSRSIPRWPCRRPTSSTALFS
ncbi:MAG: hypothetical protein U1E14_04800 [Geminicoccaceae bacterium]